MKVILSFLFLFLLITGCQQETQEQSPFTAQTIDNDSVRTLFDEGPTRVVDLNYTEVTEEALEVLAGLQVYNKDIERWFIRYYIETSEKGQSFTPQEILNLAEERHEFESAWREYAYKEYGVEVTEEDIDSQVEYNVDVYEDFLPLAVQGMSKGLNLSFEEFIREFDRDYVERTVLWQKLMPILLAKHHEEESDRLDGVFLGQAYEKEVWKYVNNK